MLKSQLVQRIHRQNSHLYQQDVEKLIDVILEEITKALCHKGRVEIRGFGSFSTKLRPAREGRNPRTGTSVSVPQKMLPSFKAGKEMHARLNPATTEPIVALADQVSKEPARDPAAVKREAEEDWR